MPRKIDETLVEVVRYLEHTPHAYIEDTAQRRELAIHLAYTFEQKHRRTNWEKHDFFITLDKFLDKETYKPKTSIWILDIREGGISQQRSAFTTEAAAITRAMEEESDAVKELKLHTPNQKTFKAIQKYLEGSETDIELECVELEN